MKKLYLLFLTSTLLSIPYTSLAIPPLAGKFVFSINPGIAFYAMADVNHMITSSQTGYMGIVPSERLESMGLSLALGTSLQYALTDFLIAGMDFSYLVADSIAKVNSSEISPPQDQYYIISLPAMESGAFLKGALPLNDSFLFTLGAGVYHLFLLGAGERLESRGRLTGLVYSSTSIPYSGSGYSLKILGGIDFFIWEWLSLGLEAGYRWAKIDEVTGKIDGRQITLQNEDNSNFTLDYSGCFLHYAFRFYF